MADSGPVTTSADRLSRPKKQVGAVVALLLIAPFSAELLLGYDDLVGQPLGIVISLVFFVPLYGAPALLIREVVRRTGRGWPTILLLGLAFGLVQAGLIDHGLFNPDYRAIPYWEPMRSHTFVEPLSTSAFMISNFVIGHMIRSTAVPIAVAEALFPARADRPWLGLRGLVVVTAVWILAAAYIAWDSIRTEEYVPEPGQLGITALLVLALVVLAFLLPQPYRCTRSYRLRGSGSLSRRWCSSAWRPRCIAGPVRPDGFARMCWPRQSGRSRRTLVSRSWFSRSVTRKRG